MLRYNLVKLTFMLRCNITYYNITYNITSYAEYNLLQHNL